MNEFLAQSTYFVFFLSILVYWFCSWVQKKLPYAIFNPLLWTVVIIVVILSVLHIDYEVYNSSAKYITYLLTPATVCLAIPMYKQIQVLKDNAFALIASILCGCLACALSIFAMCWFFGLETELYHSLQSKSVTTAIAIGITGELEGSQSITILAVMITGLFGAIVARFVCRIFKITNPVAVGLACGNSAHAIGTSTALTFGEVQGAMSSLAVVVAGVITVVVAPLFAGLL